MKELSLAKRIEITLRALKASDIECSYESALRLAGADVLVFKEFGSYQGTWLALVVYQNQRGIVRGSYGSCSGCDSLQSEFDYSSRDDDPEFVFKFALFGEQYLDHLHTPEELLPEFRENSEWDSESSAIVAFLEGLK